MNNLQSMIDAWSETRRLDDTYEAVETYASAGHGRFWPYPVLLEEIESGWPDDERRGALALNLARSYHARAHALAAFVTLAGRWPTENATTALNLLALVHRAAPSSHGALDKFLCHVSLECLKNGLRDARPLVSEEAANILGGLSRHHFLSSTSHEVESLRHLAGVVLDRIDDVRVSAFLLGRMEAVLGDAQAESPPARLSEEDARHMLEGSAQHWLELGPALKSADALATLKTHVAAQAWRCAAVGKTQAVQVICVYPANGGTPSRAWSVMDPWFDTVRSLVRSVVAESPEPRPKTRAHNVSFSPLAVMSGSLLVTLRVDADAPTQEAITHVLQSAAKASPVGEVVELDELGDLLRRQKIRVRVAHVEADGASASIGVGPRADEPTSGPLRSRKLTTSEIPQANDVDKLLAVIECAGRGEPVTMAALGVNTDRQVQYYKAAARILDLVASGELTRAGWLVYVAKGDDKYARVRSDFEASPCGQAWLEWAGVSKLADIPKETAKRFLAARSQLTGDTVSRRASTLDGWLEKLSRY